MSQFLNFLKGRKNKGGVAPDIISAGHLNLGNQTGYLQGSLLVASSNVIDPLFSRAVIYIASHDEHGAMGLILNREVKQPESRHLFKSLGIENKNEKDLPVFLGGPVDTGRGFVLHSSEYTGKNTVALPGDISITSDRGIIEDYLKDAGPKKIMLVMGYAGWVGGQIESEIREGSWITVPASKDFIFDSNSDNKWQNSAIMHGIDLFKISPFTGNA